MDGDGQTINLLREPTTEQRLLDAAHSERTLVQMLSLPGARPYDVTDEITAAQARAELFDAMARERMTVRQAGALPLPAAPLGPHGAFAEMFGVDDAPERLDQRLVVFLDRAGAHTIREMASVFSWTESATEATVRRCIAAGWIEELERATSGGGLTRYTTVEDLEMPDERPAVER